MRRARRSNSGSAHPRPAAHWPDGHRAALSFSFDDARPSQLRHGVPALDRLGVPATFFVLPDAVQESVAGWADAIASGHEIGNHTLTHPCSANFPWSRHNALETMTIDDYRSEVTGANRRLGDLLGIEPTVFAYPCGHTFVGRGRATRSVVPLVAAMFEVARTSNDVVANSPLDFDPAQVAAVTCDGLTFDHLLGNLEAVAEDGAWLVLCGHEVARASEVAHPGETTLVETVESVTGWCRSNGVWIDTVGTIARAAVELGGR
jgi:peptidoglycan/xylan/chitin deacetylase (PgdA/CDA1 family)